MRRSGISIFAFILVLSLLLSFLPTATTAQNEFESTQRFKFSPAPGTECSSFLVTEMSFLYRIGRVDSKPSWYEFVPSRSNRYMFNWQLGYMSNMSDRDAWGGALNLSAGDDRYRVGFGPMYRRWFRHHAFFDASAGIMISGEEDGFYAQGLPVYAQVGLGVLGTLSVVARIEHIQFKNDVLYAYGGPFVPPNEWNATFFHVGVNVGGEPGAVLCSVSALIAAMAILSPHGHTDGVTVPFE